MATTPYDAIIDKGADAIRDAMRSRADLSNIHVWAVPTTPDRDGYIFAGSDCPVPGAPLIRPSDNGASTHRSWSSIPYAGMRTVLWNACRREPILPRTA